jgi:hypothetical protein
MAQSNIYAQKIPENDVFTHSISVGHHIFRVVLWPMSLLRCPAHRVKLLEQALCWQRLDREDSTKNCVTDNPITPKWPTVSGIFPQFIIQTILNWHPIYPRNAVSNLFISHIFIYQFTNQRWFHHLRLFGWRLVRHIFLKMCCASVPSHYASCFW